MSKKSVLLILFILIMSFVFISLYTTFAYNEEATKLDESNADYNLIYSLKETSNRQIMVAANDEKYIDIILDNTYSSDVKYGIYYKLISPKKIPEGLTISKADASVNQLEDIISSGSSKTISLRLTNKSEYNVEVVVGALIGFPNGDLNELIENGEKLVK